MTVRLTFENPPATDDPTLITRTEIAQQLTARPNRWAIVARHDRAARAAAMVDRIVSGREYGDGYEAVARQVGADHRVYARHVR